MPDLTIYEAALAEAYAADAMGTAAVYTPPAGAAVETTVIISCGEGPDAEGADEFAPDARIRVLVSAVAAAAAGGVFTVGGEDWEVLFARKSADGLEWICDANKR